MFRTWLRKDGTPRPSSPSGLSQRNSWETTRVEDQSDGASSKLSQIVVESVISSVGSVEDSVRLPSRSVSQQEEATRNEEMNKSECSSIVEQKSIKITVQSKILSVAFLADGWHTVGGDDHGLIRCWRVEDGEEVGTPMNAGSAVFSIAASQDGKWIVSGTESGQVIVWDAESREKVNEFKAHEKAVDALDISPDGTTVATGSGDGKTTVWSLPGGKGLFNREDRNFHTVKFSPDGRLIAFAFGSTGLRIRDSQSGSIRSDVRIFARSVAWSWDSKQIFVLSDDGNIHRLDVLSKTTLSKWAIHSSDKPTCISLSRNGAFIAASANSSVSFWNTSTHQQTGCVIHHPDSIGCIAISRDCQLVIAGTSNIALCDLCNVLSASYVDVHVRCKRTETHLNEAIQSLRANLSVQNTKSVDLEKTVEGLCIKLANSQQILRAYRQKHECETLYADGRVIDAAKSLLDIISYIDDLKTDLIIINWLSAFTNKCVITLEGIGDGASGTQNDDQALAAYTAALSLVPPSPHALLIKWATTMMLHGSTDEALDAANEFKFSRVVIYRALCDVLEGSGRVTEAIECFRQLQNELPLDTSIENERMQWELDFQRRCTERLGTCADAALDSQNYNDADQHFSIILSLDAPGRVETLIKRSRARATMKLWEEALKDADEVITLDSSSYQGYEQRHAALHGAKRYAEAVEAFDTMLLKLETSPDERVRELRLRYADARPTIRSIIHGTISHMPRVLIDTTNGRLLDRTDQAKAFEALPIFNELVSSMTSEVDHARIYREVKDFYRYVMFSHRWGHGEPLFQKVERVTVYKLEVSPANFKLQTFCSVVRSLKIRWAWSDTCCIDKENNVVLQESLVAMFGWYRGSTLTIIHLCDVSSDGPDGIRNSVWNTRVWTYQEYVAAKQVQFYTRDWKPYRGLTLLNHKESPIILSEMEVPQFSAEQLAILRPGLDRVREKLYLASRRQTTLTEDVAYSLLGILNASIPVIYGEGTRSVGRLLEFVLTGSGDATILAWTGTANDYNSCLPENLTVYDPLVPPHIPHMDTVELDQKVTELRSSLSDLTPAKTLYDQLNGLPSAMLASSRLRLPCLHFPITELVCLSGPNPKTNVRTYRATTTMFKDIEVRTTHDLSKEREHYLAHPWIRPLLDQEYARGTVGLDKMTRALRLVVRLGQEFGALMFEKVSRVEHKRVATDSLIRVQLRDDVPLTDLIDNVETIEVL